MSVEPSVSSADHATTRESEPGRSQKRVHRDIGATPRTALIALMMLLVAGFAAGCASKKAASPPESAAAGIGAANGTGTSAAPQGNSSTASLVGSCAGYYNAQDWGFTDGTNPTPYCQCAISSWLQTDTPAQISSAMEADAADGGGEAPLAFSQSNCDGDPTIDPQTGAPFSS